MCMFATSSNFKCRNSYRLILNISTKRRETNFLIHMTVTQAKYCRLTVAFNWLWYHKNLHDHWHFRKIFPWIHNITISSYKLLAIKPISLKSSKWAPSSIPPSSLRRQFNPSPIRLWDLAVTLFNFLITSMCDYFITWCKARQLTDSQHRYRSRRICWCMKMTLIVIPAFHFFVKKHINLRQKNTTKKHEFSNEMSSMTIKLNILLRKPIFILIK